MSKFNLLRFTYEEAHFCCGMQEIGDFSDGGAYGGQLAAVDKYEDAVKNLREKLLRAEARPDEEELEEAGEDGPFDGCRALIATVPTSWKYRHKLLIDAGMVEVKRWVNVNSGNELALLVSPDEWPELK